MAIYPPDIRQNGPAGTYAMTQTRPVTQLNGEVFSSPTITRTPFTTFDTVNSCASNSESNLLSLAVSISGSTLDKKAMDYAATVYYATGSGTNDVALPNDVQRYASNSPYYFDDDLTLTYLGDGVGRLDAVKLQPTLVTNKSSYLNISFLEDSFTTYIGQVIGATYNKRAVDCAEVKAVIRRIGGDAQVEFYLRDPDARFPWKIGASVIVPGISNWVVPSTAHSVNGVWVDERTVVWTNRLSNTVVITSIDNAITPTITVKTLILPAPVAAMGDVTTGFIGAGVPIVTLDGAETSVHIVPPDGTSFHTVFTRSAVLRVLGFVTEGAAAQCTCVTGVGTIEVLTWKTGWLNSPSVVQHSVPNIELYLGHGYATLEGVIYIPIVRSNMHFALLNPNTGGTLTRADWTVGAITAVYSVHATSQGMIVLTNTNIYHLLNARSQFVYALASGGSRCVQDINGTVIWYTANAEAALFVRSTITNKLYFRMVRNIRNHPFAAPYPEHYNSALNATFRVQINSVSYNGTITVPYSYIHTFCGFAFRGGNRFAVVLLGNTPVTPNTYLNTCPSPVLVPLVQVPNDGLERQNTVVWGSLAVGLTVRRQLNTFAGTIYCAYSSKLRHTSNWLVDETTRRSATLKLAAGDIDADRYTSLDVPVSLRYVGADGGTVLERYQPGTQHSSVTLNTDLGVDETVLTGMFTSFENGGDAYISTFMPRLDMLNTSAFAFGVLSIYDSLTYSLELTP